jgi:L-ascorbate metabolism protein UlaG (beta-lactamase superfamily)
MQGEGGPAHGHAIGDALDIGPVRVELTPADHAWQNASPGANDRVFQPEDACRFWIETPDGTVWAPGDSRLIPDHHLQMPAPDALLFDFSDSEWHFGLEGAARMANGYPKTPLLLHHWGCVDAPRLRPVQRLPGLVEIPERIVLPSPAVASHRQ